MRSVSEMLMVSVTAYGNAVTDKEKLAQLDIILPLLVGSVCALLRKEKDREDDNR